MDDEKISTEDVKSIETELITEAQIKAIANKTGLWPSTVRDLLQSGWNYTTTIRHAGRWERIF